jgi:hypothetical protein
MLFFGRLKRSKQGVGSIIGGVFILLILLTGYTFYFLNVNVTEGYNKILQDMGELDLKRNKENLEFISVSFNNDQLNISVKNTGSYDAHLIWLGIFDETVTSNTQEYYEIDFHVDPAETVPDIRNVTIPTFEGQERVIQLVTELGNTFSYSYPPPSVTGIYAYDFVDQEGDPPTVGSHSLFSAQQYGPDGICDTLTEANTGGTVNTEDFVDGNLSNVDSHAGYGTSSNFTAQKDANVAFNDTLTEEYTVGSALTITFRAEGAEATGTGAVTPALPAGITNGDIMILVATTIAGGTITITADGSVSPWTAISGSPVDVTGGEKLYVWWGRYTSGSTGPTVTPGSDHIEAGIAAWYNCLSSGSPIDVSQTGNETTSDTSFSFATSISTSLDSEMCLCICTTGEDTNANGRFTTMTDASLTSLAERIDYETASGGGGGFALDEGYKAVAGAVGTWASTLQSASAKAYISFTLKPEYAANYQIDYEFNYTVADWGQTNEYLCIRTYTFTGTAENLKVDVWSGGAWVNLIASLTANAWNNVSISSNLTSANIYFRFLGASEASDSSQNTWIIECNLIHYWTDPNYELDLEVQWTNANYDEAYKWLCIYGRNGSEQISVYVWSGTDWIRVLENLESGWNNADVSSYLTSPTFKVRFRGGTETGDLTEDKWEIDATFLHAWS